MLPTRNCREGLPAHLAAIEEWLPEVQEIVVVDSDSTDGTLEFLQQNLRHPRIQFLSHPPGLYESWNCGLERIRARYTYIATVGDAAPATTLRGLVSVAEQHSADAVVSPPDFVDHHGKPLVRQWPIHHLLSQPGARKASLLSAWEWFAWAVMYLPGSLLGSSASNVYRTDYMQRHPFPLGYGHACDTAWALANAFEARIAVAPDLHSLFWVHGTGQAETRETHMRHMFRLTDLAYAMMRAQPEVGPIEPERRELVRLLSVCLEELRFKASAKMVYRGLRRPWFPWFLQPSAARQRLESNRSKARLNSMRADIVSCLSAEKP